VTGWATLADAGTAAGTLVLAGATFVSVRASARSTRIAERALLAGQRPVLAPAGPGDQAQSVRFADGRVFPAGCGQALALADGEVIYLAIALCNVGAGLALLSGYHLQGETASQVADDPAGPARHRRGDQLPPAGAFAAQQRDLLIGAGRPGFWQAALRDPDDPLHADVAGAISTRGRITVDVRYGDHERGQPSVTRFVLLPDGDSWRCDATRHWSLPPGREAGHPGLA
jgi:hypothetical protein